MEAIHEQQNVDIITGIVASLLVIDQHNEDDNNKEDILRIFSFLHPGRGHSSRVSRNQ